MTLQPTYTDRVLRPPAEGGQPDSADRGGLPAQPVPVLRNVQGNCLSRVMALPYAKLKAVFEACRAAFPELTRIGVYANGSSLAARRPEELAELRELKLSTAYVGLETGDDALLASVCKKETGERAVCGVRKLQATGAKASVMVLLGLGGKTGSARHVAATVEVLNRMQPRLLSALRLVDVPGTTMHAGYETLSEYESVRELRDLIDGLKFRTQ